MNKFLSLRLSIAMAAIVTLCLGGCGGSSGSAPNSSGNSAVSATAATPAATVATASPEVPLVAATPATVGFDPPVIQLDNPAAARSNAKAQEISLNLSALDSAGNRLRPSESNPMHVDVYGAPTGVITPVHQLCTTSTAKFHYTGDDFPNNISVNVWIADKKNGGAAIGVTQMLKKNPRPHHGTVKHDIALTKTLPDALKIKAAVGYDAKSADAALKDFTIDTGSLGVLVPFSELPKSDNVIGPGPEGTKFYSSSGNTYYGHFYLAPVSFKRSDGKIVQTIPIVVLAIETTACTGDASLPCHNDTHPPSPDLHYLGIGFNRNSTDPKDLFNSPTANAFLHLTDDDNGVNISPGYYLTPNDSGAKTGLSLGITSTDGYNVVDLKANKDVPGDFLPQKGTFKFPNAKGQNEFTGTALLDVGIDSMFLDAPKDQWPDNTFDADHKVPVGTDMEVSMGSESTTAMSYKFTIKSPPDSTSPAPVDAKWIDTAKTGAIFINTGRRPLFNFDYFYDGQDGRVGFLKL